MGYTRCLGRTSVAASLQNLAVLQEFSPLSVSLLNDLADPAFDGVGQPGFKTKAIPFLSD